MASNALRFLDIDCTAPDILDKDHGVYQYVSYMLDRTTMMFSYEGLPDTIPSRILEMMLQCYGAVTFAYIDSSIYAFRPAPGGEPDIYYRPTQSIIANAALEKSYVCRIANHFAPLIRSEWDKMPECVYSLNDYTGMGILPLLKRYAYLLVENDISIRSMQINLREQRAIVVDGNSEYESAMAYIKKLEGGEPAVMMKRPMMDGITVIPNTVRPDMINGLLELHQYIKASCYNDLGLAANYQMKREYVSDKEYDVLNEVMIPLVDNMFVCRHEMADYLSRVFGLSVKVSKNSAWDDERMEVEGENATD